MAPHSSTLAWKIPWTEEPDGLQSMGSRLSDFTFTFHFHALEKEMVTHSSILAWRIPGTGEPGGLPSMGSHRVGLDWSDLAGANHIISKHSLQMVKILNIIFMTSFDPWIKSLPFFMPSVHFTMGQRYGLKINDHHCFSLKHMEQNLIDALLWIWVLKIDQTKDTFQEFRTREQDVYWKQDWGFRVLHWLPSNFYCKTSHGRKQKGTKGERRE